MIKPNPHQHLFVNRPRKPTYAKEKPSAMDYTARSARKKAEEMKEIKELGHASGEIWDE
ncbi:MAG: hypothetical protein GWN00_19925 [Aliifodinibius sp.]|nr:hypothetical protein [Fodinibius sp.]NIY26990.1 hypothetical protein [Fodinibius sp.]